MDLYSSADGKLPDIFWLLRDRDAVDLLVALVLSSAAVLTMLQTAGRSRLYREPSARQAVAAMGGGILGLVLCAVYWLMLGNAATQGAANSPYGALLLGGAAAAIATALACWLWHASPAGLVSGLGAGCLFGLGLVAPQMAILTAANTMNWLPAAPFSIASSGLIGAVLICVVLNLDEHLSASGAPHRRMRRPLAAVVLGIGLFAAFVIGTTGVDPFADGGAAASRVADRVVSPDLIVLVAVLLLSSWGIGRFPPPIERPPHRDDSSPADDGRLDAPDRCRVSDHPPIMPPGAPGDGGARATGGADSGRPARQAEAGRCTEPLGPGGPDLRPLLVAAPVGIYVKDAGGHCLFANERYADWFDKEPAGPRGSGESEAVSADLAARISATEAGARRSGQPSHEDLQLPVPGGSTRQLELTCFPVADSDGAAMLGGVAVDVTGYHEELLELRERESNAALANRSKSEFLANMSHELRTPLNAIIGFSEMIGGEMLGAIGQPKYLEYASDIHSSATHLLALINDILDLSKIEAGNEELVEEAVLVSDLLGSVITLVKSRAHESGVQLLTEPADELPVLLADSRKLKQILVNLLTNAIKFTPEKGCVTLAAKTDADTGEFLFIVTDTGIGMAAEDIPKALSAFNQLDRQFGRKHEGTGLGLPLTKRMVEMHFGTLTVESQLGEGTTITVRLPTTRVQWPETLDDAVDSGAEASVFTNY